MTAQLVHVMLALVTVVIIALALSASKDGAKLSQGLLVIAILAVVLRNEPKVQAFVSGLSTTILRPPS